MNISKQAIQPCFMGNVDQCLAGKKTSYFVFINDKNAISASRAEFVQRWTSDRGTPGHLGILMGDALHKLCHSGTFWRGSGASGGGGGGFQHFPISEGCCLLLAKWRRWHSHCATCMDIQMSIDVMVTCMYLCCS